MEICTWKTLQIKFFVYLVNCNILCYLLDELLIYLLLGSEYSVRFLYQVYNWQ